MKRKNEKPNINDVVSESIWKNPNVVWTLCVMTAIIILLIGFIVVYRMCNASVLVDYISNVALFLSIVLSVMAIQYTYISNNHTLRQFENINRAANHIQQSAFGIEHSHEKIDKTLNELRTAIDNITVGQNDLKTSIENQQKGIAARIYQISNDYQPDDALINLRQSRLTNVASEDNPVE